jgi:hypothetical protein
LTLVNDKEFLENNLNFLIAKGLVNFACGFATVESQQQASEKAFKKVNSQHFLFF